jgi:hypothetical protein
MSGAPQGTPFGPTRYTQIVLRFIFQIFLENFENVKCLPSNSVNFGKIPADRETPINASNRVIKP